MKSTSFEPPQTSELRYLHASFSLHLQLFAIAEEISVRAFGFPGMESLKWPLLTIRRRTVLVSTAAIPVWLALSGSKCIYLPDRIRSRIVFYLEPSSLRSDGLIGSASVKKIQMNATTMYKL